MILFLEDWNKYPTAIVHLSTKNNSFLRVAGIYKKMGVKNYAFMLSLLNPLLEHLDPYDPNLTLEQKLMIAEECKLNPWYIIREIIRIPVDGSPDPIRFIANRGNIAIFWLFFNHVTSLLIMPRQTGKSVAVDCLSISLMYMMCMKTSMQLFTKDDSLRVKNIARLKGIRDELPSYLNQTTKEDVNNTEMLTVKTLGNTYTTSVPQKSRKDALKIGRGNTTAIQHIDEISYIDNIDVSLPALLASSNAATDNAKLNNAPYGFIFTTTAGHLSNPAGEYVKNEIYDKALRWTEHLLDCTDTDDLHKTIRKNNVAGKKVLVLAEFNHRQLGKTDEWLLKKMEDAFADGEDAEADFLNKWNVGNKLSAIGKEFMDIMLGNRILEPYIEVKEDYIINWYISKKEVEMNIPHRKLILSLDTSEAIGGDDIALTVRDVSTGEVIATGTYNELNTILFSEWIANEWLLRYPNLTMIVERKSTGLTIMENVMLILHKNGIDPFKRIFNWIVDECDVNKEYYKALTTPMHHRDISFYSKYKKHFGYATAGSGKQARSILYGKILNSSLKYTCNTIRDATIINQMSKLMIINGRIDHLPGEHDDSVISYLLGYWFLSEAKNKSYYGINSREVLNIVVAVDVYLAGGEEVLKNHRYNSEIKKDIMELENKVKHAGSEYEKIMINNKINYLKQQLKEETETIINQDRFLEESKSYLKYTLTRPNGNVLYGI